jgi:hypothetical protein
MPTGTGQSPMRTVKVLIGTNATHSSVLIQWQKGSLIRLAGRVTGLTPQLEQEAQRQVAQQRIHQAGQQHSRSGGVSM